MATIDPRIVRFSQNSIKSTFRDGRTIDTLARGLISGTIPLESVPPIRLVEKDGNLYSLDNRRLEAFRRTGIHVPYRMATADEERNETYKFTTMNEGNSIRVRES